MSRYYAPTIKEIRLSYRDKRIAELARLIKRLNLESHIQPLFDHVASHLLAQNAKSDRCYGTDGKKDAIGCLIKPEYYSPLIEYTSLQEESREDVEYLVLVGSLMLSLDIPEELLGIRPNRMLPLEVILLFIQNMQEIHDVEEVKDWPEALRLRASVIGLCLPHCLE